MLKIALAQINPTIGDIEGNLALIRDAAHEAVRQGAAIVVFPELALSGYYPADLLLEPQFQVRIKAGLEALRSLSGELAETYLVVGAPTFECPIGKRMYNSLIVLKAAKVLLTYHKQLLPTYNIFDERRHFEPGPDVAEVLQIRGMRVGFLICEDGWNDAGKDYPVNPFARLAEAHPDLVVSINASPSNLGKRQERERVFGEACTRHNVPLLYVNQVGGHDQLIYDGASFAFDPACGVVYEAVSFEREVTTLIFDPKGGNRSVFCVPSKASTGLRPECGSKVTGYQESGPSEFYRQQIVLGLRDYARRCGFRQAVVGSSGGIDSALTLALAAETLGAKNVTAITMPSEYSSTGSVRDSERLCENLGVTLLTHPIGDLVQRYQREFERATAYALTGLALENLQARIRGTILMEYSNQFGHLLLTTGNKSEISVGYCTLYGDTNGGLGLIGDLYKTEVFELSQFLNERAGYAMIPDNILNKPPSAELAPGQKDTDSLPPYEVLDEILKVLIEADRLSEPERERAYAAYSRHKKTVEGQALLQRIQRMVARNEYKRRQAPPILRVRSRAFGNGRQMPIAARY